MSKKADFLENCLLADFGQKPSFSNKVTFSREHALFLQKLGFGTNGSIFDQKQHFRRICEETSKKSKNALNCAKVYRKTVHILISKLAQLGDPDRRSHSRQGQSRVYWSPVPVKLGYPLSIEWDQGFDSTVQTIKVVFFLPRGRPGGKKTRPFYRS